MKKEYIKPLVFFESIEDNDILNISKAGIINTGNDGNAALDDDIVHGGDLGGGSEGDDEWAD